MYSLKPPPLTPPSLSITKASSSSDVLLCDPTSAAAAAGGGNTVLMGSTSPPPPPPPVVITTPADVVSVSGELVDRDVMRRNLSMVDTAADGVNVDTACVGSDPQQLQTTASSPSSASKTFSQSVDLFCSNVASRQGDVRGP